MRVSQYPVDPRVASAEDVRLIGGSACIDFVNTVLWRGTDREQDVLRDYPDLLVWARRLGLLSSKEAGALGDLSAGRPAEAWAAHRNAIRFRQALHRVLIACIDGQKAATADLETVKRLFADSIADASFVQTGGSLRWVWPQGASRLDRPLWPVAHDAVRLLLLDPMPRIGRCAAQECGWLFLDHSKNKSRRWCSMEGCGSRVKMRRHYARMRAERASGSAP